MSKLDTVVRMSNMFPRQVSRTGQTCLLYSLLISALVSSLSTTHEVTEAPPRCNSYEFECDNGFCIVSLWRCDEEDDCRDNSDEINCPEVVLVCSEGQFKCDTGSCVPGRWRCDQELDCDDGSDEEGCSTPTEQPMFNCMDRQSGIPVEWHCDGQADCGDHSDEIDCAASLTPSFTCVNGTKIDIVYRCDAVPQCQHGEDEKECSVCPGFLCSNNRCIQARKYCDGVNDCRNGDDEPVDCNPSCMVENGGCEQICLQRLDTVVPVCDCNEGYELFNNTHCQDINECEDQTGACPGYPMVCINELGTFSCVCPTGFNFHEERQTCFANDSVSPPVIFSTRESVMYLSSVYTNYTMDLTPGKYFRGITAIDFDPQEGTIFFSEIGPNRILKYFLTTREAEVIADEGVQLVDGIAYDWIYDNLYFTEAHFNRIEVISMKKFFRKILFETDLDEPRGIAVDPLEGYFYFTDWGAHPKIEKAAMDGSSRRIIIDENLYWPNGICIEYTLRRLFWANAVPPGYQGSYIASSDLDGGRIKILVEGPSSVQLPFAISVFQDNIYWTDWGLESLMTANSFTGSGWSVVLQNIPAPMDIKVFNRKAKYNGNEKNLTAVENFCPTDMNVCSHMCLAAPNENHYSCGCPNNAFLGVDMTTCFCNATVKMNEDGVTCGGRKVESETPANAMAGGIGTPSPVEPPIKFNMEMKCRIFDLSLKCRLRNSLELLPIPDYIPEELSCKFRKTTGELICKF